MDGNSCLNLQVTANHDEPFLGAVRGFREREREREREGEREGGQGGGST